MSAKDYNKFVEQYMVRDDNDEYFRGTSDLYAEADNEDGSLGKDKYEIKSRYLEGTSSDKYGTRYLTEEAGVSSSGLIGLNITKKS